MKRVIGIMLSIALLLFVFISAHAQSQEDFITDLTNKISKDLGLQSTPSLYFYNAPDWPVIAGYYDCINYVYVNLGVLESEEETVRAIAHELRHDYQFEHMNDDTDYGRAVKANKQNYISYYTDIDAYFAQFTEQDAEQYAQDYVKRYFKR